MKELIQFSLRNRFYNKATILLNIILFLMVFFLFTVDLIILAVEPNFYERPRLMISSEIETYQPWLIEALEKDYQIVSKDNEEAWLLTFKQGSWKIQSDIELTASEMEVLKNSIQSAMKQYREDCLTETIIDEYKVFYEIELINDTAYQITNNVSDGKQSLIFMVITAIYFMMLSYSAMIANEVVHEKTSRVLELILTSVTTRTHLIAKMLTSWLTIMIQIGLLCSYVILLGGIRIMHDYGNGLVRLLSKINLLDAEVYHLSQIIQKYGFNYQTAIQGIWMLMYLFIGILFVQVVLVIISSYVKTVEESASIQGPFYFFLLFVYYCTLFSTNPSSLNEGFGYIGSFIPFLSMLFMPARLIMGEVPITEKLIGLLIATGVLVLTIVKGDKYYKRGILNNQLRKRKG